MVLAPMYYEMMSENCLREKTVKKGINKTAFVKKRNSTHCTALNSRHKSSLNLLIYNYI